MRHTTILATAALAIVSLAPPAVAAPLAASALYREKARDCRTLDLKTWSHPTRTVMEKNRVQIAKVELCNGGVYPVFTVALPGEPMVGINDAFFNRLYDRMIVANGYHSLAFVDAGRGVIVTIDMTGRKTADIDYEEFDPAK